MKEAPSSASPRAGSRVPSKTPSPVQFWRSATRTVRVRGGGLACPQTRQAATPPAATARTPTRIQVGLGSLRANDVQMSSSESWACQAKNRFSGNPSTPIHVATTRTGVRQLEGVPKHVHALEHGEHGDHVGRGGRTRRRRRISAAREVLPASGLGTPEEGTGAEGGRGLAPPGSPTVLARDRPGPPSAAEPPSCESSLSYRFGFESARRSPWRLPRRATMPPGASSPCFPITSA